jgi:hypothetical protein
LKVARKVLERLFVTHATSDQGFLGRVKKGVVCLEFRGLTKRAVREVVDVSRLTGRMAVKVSRVNTTTFSRLFPDNMAQAIWPKRQAAKRRNGYKKRSDRKSKDRGTFEDMRKEQRSSHLPFGRMAKSRKKVKKWKRER